jgi:hypothetical protein
LYSDAFYKAKEAENESEMECNHEKEVEEEDIPKGYFHVDLPTLLDEKSLSVDVARYGGFISIKINDFASVVVQDGVARDGVIHVVGNVLIPPKTPGAFVEEEEGEMEVEELKERLIPYLGGEL